VVARAIRSAGGAKQVADLTLRARVVPDHRFLRLSFATALGPIVGSWLDIVSTFPAGFSNRDVPVMCVTSRLRLVFGFSSRLTRTPDTSMSTCLAFNL
jgi:hypothetical protein